MSRYVNRVSTKLPKEGVDQVVAQIMTKEGFTFVTYKGEQVWKKGSGWVAAPQFLKYQYLGDAVEIQAWIKYAWLPGVYMGEMGLKGFFGWAIKALLKKRVDEVEYAVANAYLTQQ